MIERDLHDCVQQHLVAIAVNLQLAGSLADSDAEGARKLLEEMEREVQQALDETAHLAQRIYAPLLEAGGLAAALRAAAVSARLPASVDVPGGSSYPPAVARTIYLCWLGALDDETPASLTVREEGDVLTLEIVGNAAGVERLRDRVEALGGQLSIRGTRVTGSLPLS
jgi:signal transduction histidine kinase